MNPGRIIENVIDGMKHQPIFMAMIVLNIVFLIFFWWSFSSINSRTAADLARTDTLIAKLLEKCAN